MRYIAYCPEHGKMKVEVWAEVDKYFCDICKSELTFKEEQQCTKKQESKKD